MCRCILAAITAALVFLARPAVADKVPTHQAWVRGGTCAARVGAVSGQDPSAEHPRGTLFVAWSVAGRGVTLTEWDLAKDRVVRGSSLGWRKADDVRAARVGDGIHVLANHDGQRVGYARVDARTLKLACTVEVGNGSVAGVAADSNVVAVAWETERPDFAFDLHVAMLDQSCHVTGKTTFFATSQPNDVVAVVGGRGVVAVQTNHAMDVALLDSAANVIARKGLPGDKASPFLVTAPNGHVLLGGDPAFELSPSLDILATHAVGVYTAKLAVAADGRILTGDAFVLGSTFAVQGNFDQGQGWVHQLLWVGSLPVTVTTTMEGNTSVLVSYPESPIP